MRRRSRKGDPPRGPPGRVGGGDGRARGRGDRVDLRGSGDDDGGRAEGSRSEPRPSSEGCSRRGRGHSACRWRRSTGSEGISLVAASPSGVPRPAVRPNEDTTDDAPGSRKTCDNPGGSSLCAYEDRGSSTRGLGASTPGPHSVLATVGHPWVCKQRRVWLAPCPADRRRSAHAPGLERGASAPGSMTPESGRSQSTTERPSCLSRRRDAQKTSLLRDR